MRSFGLLFYPWGLILQGIALVHFIRRRPDTYWLWIIIFFGPIGALIYIFLEVVPDVGLLRHSFDGFPRRKRIRVLEATILDNPSPGNYEELGDLYLDEGKFLRARECYDRAISPRADLPDPFYRRGIAEIQLGDFEAAVRDLEYVVSRDARYDSYRGGRYCWLTLSRIPERQKEPRLCFSTPPNSRHSRRRTTTMRASLRHTAGQGKPANGPSEFSRRNRPCPDIFGVANARGSEGRMDC